MNAQQFIKLIEKSDYRNPASSKHPSKLQYNHKLVGLSLLRVGTAEDVLKAFADAIQAASLGYARYALEFLQRSCALVHKMNIVVRKSQEEFLLQRPNDMIAIDSDWLTTKATGYQQASIMRAIKVLNERN